MYPASLAIATITLARTEAEEKILRTSLQSLAALNLPVFVTDGGSSTGFVSFLTSLPNFTVFAAKGLWPQARKSITAAADSGVKNILYTEPDKAAFFNDHLPSLLQKEMTAGLTGVVLASRSNSGFVTFPHFQQMTEQTINRCCIEVIGLEADYCYGPFLFQSRLARSLSFLPDECGWGWRPALFVTAHRLGMSLDCFMGNFTCPPDQQQDNEKERLYRMKQLTQNIEGLLLAANAALPDNH